jgi:hypothetical protein
MPLPSAACYDVRIDWYADGDYDDAVDDVSGRVLANPGLTIESGRDTARSTGPPMIGISEFVLDNRDRALSPENATSLIYQYIVPGRPVQIQALHGSRSPYREHTPYRENDPYRGVAAFALGAGQLETMQHQPGWGQQTVAISALSTMKHLKRRIVSVELQGPITTDTAVNLVLNAAGWPPDRRVVHISDSVLQLFWVDERPAWDVLVELVATEGPGSLLYQDGAGILYWKNRNHRATDVRSVNVQAQLVDGTDLIGPFDLPYTELQYDPRWVDIITRATVATKWRQAAAAPEVVWKLGAALTMTQIVHTLYARPPDPFVAAITPALGTDYTVSGGTASVALAWANGAVAKLTVTALTGSPTVNDLQLRARPYPVVGETQIEASVTVPDETLEKTLAVSAWPELAPEHAQAICNAYIDRFQESRPSLVVRIPATDGRTLKAILRVQISDRLTVFNRELGLASDVFVEKIRHEIGRGGRHVLVLSCEPATGIGTAGAIWDHPGSVWDGPTTTWGV